MNAELLRSRINELAEKKIADAMKWFFKTGKGDYGEGDQFAGLKVPTQRMIAKEFSELEFIELKKLLKSGVHEERLISLLILVDRFGKADEKQKEKIFQFYLDNRKGINNWDLVDLSAPNIVGKYLLNGDKSSVPAPEVEILFELAESKNLWEKRIAIISTMTFIKAGHFETTLRIADILLNDKHDLIHKAVGWMLREVGKKDLKVEEVFLKSRYKKMPRTMLRYAIEKFPESKRKKYLEGKI